MNRLFMEIFWITEFIRLHTGAKVVKVALVASSWDNEQKEFEVCLRVGSKVRRFDSVEKFKKHVKETYFPKEERNYIYAHRN